MLIKFEVKIELPIIRLGSLFERLEQVLDAVRGERRLTKDTHDLKDGPANLEVVLDDGNEAVCDDGNMNLYAHSILGFSPKSFNLEVLLNPFFVLHRFCSFFFQIANLHIFAQLPKRIPDTFYFYPKNPHENLMNSHTQITVAKLLFLLQ